MRVLIALLAGAMLAPAADTRVEALQQLLKPYPGRIYAKDFLDAADRYQLDWTLLPSICIVETGCGKTAARNNMFGWDSGRKRFSSRRRGIYYVAARLARLKRYRSKTTPQKLRAYNPRVRKYPEKVLRVMAELRQIYEISQRTPF